MGMDRDMMMAKMPRFSQHIYIRSSYYGHIINITHNNIQNEKRSSAIIDDIQQHYI